MTTGNLLKEAGCARALSNTPLQWRQDFEATAATLLDHNGSFNAEEVVTMIGPPPRANMVGAVCRAFCRSKDLIATYEQAKSPAAHARIISRWRRAESW